MLTTSELRRLVGRIRDRVHPDHIVLFGSSAKGTATGRSDVDLLVVWDTRQPAHNRLATLKPLYATMTVPVDVHVYTPEEVDSYGGIPFHFLNTVLLTGRVLYSAPDARPLPRVGPDRTVTDAPEASHVITEVGDRAGGGRSAADRPSLVRVHTPERTVPAAGAGEAAAPEPAVPDAAAAASAAVNASA